MPNPYRREFLDELTERYGQLTKLPGSESLYEVSACRARFYFRYSRRHPGDRMFYGLRKVDLQQLDGHRSVLYFAWEGQPDPLLVPYGQFEDVLAGLAPASDGQIKAQVYERQDGTDLYIANAGRFNVDSFYGWSHIEGSDSTGTITVSGVSHSEVQTLLGAIGASKGYDVWIPLNDRARLSARLGAGVALLERMPAPLERVVEVAEAIDVTWVERGKGTPSALYEIEHSTPIYSGLLRLNDVRLALPGLNPRYGIVSNSERRSAFARQLARPTFVASGLRDVCAFFEYANVLGWYERTRAQGTAK